MADPIVLVGGGLGNSLIAYFLAKKRGLRTTVVERGASLGGNHTWSFHEGDVSGDALALLRPLIDRSWSLQRVEFPGLSRSFSEGYHSISSRTLDTVVRGELGGLMTESEVEGVTPRSVSLRDGRVIYASGVIDGRGDLGGVYPVACGYQKFVGLDVSLEAPHGLDGPVIMDARVAQNGGFRFVYLLPWSERDILIEDTYYSDGPELDVDGVRGEIRDYADARGWRIERVLREETGVLPIPLEGDLDAIWPRQDGTARSGMRAGLFHATTGYSLPDAVRLAEAVAALPELSPQSLYAVTRAASERTWRAGRFFRFLNRMLFRAADPERRIDVMARFYRLPSGVIRRFYAGRLRFSDRARLLVGKPPVDVRRAIGCLRESRLPATQGVQP